MRKIESPNLPSSRVVLAAINDNAVDSIKSLEKLGIECLKIFQDKRLPMPISAHADIQMLHISGTNILTSNKCLYDEGFKKYYKITQITDEIGNKYPNDVKLNCTVLGNKIICNKRFVSNEVLEFAYRNGYQIINVNQGYARCSVCVLNESAIITDDPSIYSAAQNFLDDVTYIQKNSIRLYGYNYGFIGGCTGKINKNMIAFNGRVESHSNHNEIIDSLNRNNIECVELIDDVLTDIGGIIPLLQE